MTFAENVTDMKSVLLSIFLSLLLFINVHALPPERNYWITPDSLGLSYVQKTLVTPDKAKLLSWMMTTKSVRSLRTTLLIAYPAAGGNMANDLYYADAFLKAGFDVVLFDYRGFGHSSAFTINPNYLYYNEYVTDMETAIVAAKKQFPKNRLGILSFSASTILATLAAQNQPVDFLVGEGYVGNPRRIINFWKKNDPAHRILLPTGVDAYIGATRRITCPMLLMTGTRDDVTPPSDVQAVAAMRPNRKVLLYDGYHLEGTDKWKEKEFADGYVRRIRQFVASLR